MSGSEYLVERGWIRTVGKKWIDPTHYGFPVSASEAVDMDMSIQDAVVIQKARDAVEFRAAWVSFAAAKDVNFADDLLCAYQDRFTPLLEREEEKSPES